MEKSKVIEFFDKCASEWDKGLVRNEEAIACILDSAGVREGSRVLDVACGSGVLFSDYLSRKVGTLTAVDISPEMAKLAAAKAPWAEVICADAEEYDFGKVFDSIVIYNAFPHFPYPRGILNSLSGYLAGGGRLTVAHGMSRKALEKHHSGSARMISLELPEAEVLAKMFPESVFVDTVISDDEKYIVSGFLK